MICPNCKNEFAPLSVVQKYCCRKCGEEYRKKHSVDEEYPSITFRCSNCGRLVVTEGGTKDKRTRFCSESCEKKFWKHPHWEHKDNAMQIAPGWKLKARERYDN